MKSGMVGRWLSFWDGIFFWGGTCFSTGANIFSQVCYVHIGLVIVPCQRRQVPSTESAASFWISSCFMPVVASLKSSCGGWTSATVGFFGWLSSYTRDKSTQRVDSVYKNSLKIHQPLVFQWKLRIVSWKIPEKLVFFFFLRSAGAYVAVIFAREKLWKPS